MKAPVRENQQSCLMKERGKEFPTDKG